MFKQDLTQRLLEELEERRCFATVAFAEPVVLSDARHDRVLVDDWNSDGRTDVLVSNQNGFSILLNSGNGDFVTGPTVGQTRLASVTTIDLSADGDLDLLCIVGTGQKSFRPFAQQGQFGPLTRQPIIEPDNPPIFGFQFVSDDLNGDGYEDLLIVDGFFSRLSMHLATADGSSFEPGVVVASDGVLPRSLSTADLDHDGDLDILHTGKYSGLRWLENAKDDASAWTQRILDPREGGHATEAADVDSDGDLDLISHAAFGGGLQLARNDGHGNFEFETNVPQDLFPYSSVLRTADLDADRDVDVVMYSRDRGLVLFENLDRMGSLGTGVTVISQDRDGTERGHRGDVDVSIQVEVTGDCGCKMLTGAASDRMLNAPDRTQACSNLKSFKFGVPAFSNFCDRLA